MFSEIVLLLVLRSLLRSLGLRFKPCNPFVGDFYKYPLNGLWFIGDLPSGGFDEVIVPDYPDSNLLKIGNDSLHFTHLCGDKVKYVFNGSLTVYNGIKKDYYNRILHVAKKCEKNSKEGLFQYMGSYNNLYYLHFIKFEKMLSKKYYFEKIWEMKCPDDKISYIMGKVSFIDNLLKIMTIVSTLLLTIGSPNKSWVKIVCYTIFCSGLTVLLFNLLLNSNNLNPENRVWVFKYFNWIKFIEYDHSILNHEKFCVETNGRPLKCNVGDNYLILVKEGNADLLKNITDYRQLLKLNINNCEVSLERTPDSKIIFTLRSRSRFFYKKACYISEMSDISYCTFYTGLEKMAGKSKYFRFSQETNLKYRHCESFKDLIGYLSKEDYYFEEKEIKNESWVLNGSLVFSNEEFSLLLDHSKKFFGEENREAIKVGTSKFVARTPDGFKCSQWKKYLRDLNFIGQRWMKFKIPVDSRYKQNSWLEGFVNDYVYKPSVEVKTDLVNSFILEETAVYTKNLDEVLERNHEVLSLNSDKAGDRFFSESKEKCIKLHKEFCRNIEDKSRVLNDSSKPLMDEVHSISRGLSYLNNFLNINPSKSEGSMKKILKKSLNELMLEKFIEPDLKMEIAEILKWGSSWAKSRDLALSKVNLMTLRKEALISEIARISSEVERIKQVGVKSLDTINYAILDPSDPNLYKEKTSLVMSSNRLQSFSQFLKKGIYFSDEKLLAKFMSLIELRLKIKVCQFSYRLKDFSNKIASADLPKNVESIASQLGLDIKEVMPYIEYFKSVEDKSREEYMEINRNLESNRKLMSDTCSEYLPKFLDGVCLSNEAISSFQERFYSSFTKRIKNKALRNKIRKIADSAKFSRGRGSHKGKSGEKAEKVKDDRICKTAFNWFKIGPVDKVNSKPRPLLKRSINYLGERTILFYLFNTIFFDRVKTGRDLTHKLTKTYMKNREKFIVDLD